jgi:ubiquinone/menaquinone biosynthesis C-methylase UbiE
MKKPDLTAFYQGKNRLSYNPSSLVFSKRTGLKSLVAFDDRFAEVSKKLMEIILSLREAESDEAISNRKRRLPRFARNDRLKLLDVGIGNGVYEKMLPKEVLSKIDVYGIDISERQLARAKSILKEGRVIDLDSQKVPYRNEIFDIVVISEILEHVFSPEKVIVESLRVLQKGGFLILTYPNCGALQIRLSLFLTGNSPMLNYSFNKEHIRFFNKNDIEKLIDGVKTVYFSGLGSFLFDKWNFPAKIMMPRFLQVLGNYYSPNLALGNLMILQK